MLQAMCSAPARLLGTSQLPALQYNTFMTTGLSSRHSLEISPVPTHISDCLAVLDKQHLDRAAFLSLPCCKLAPGPPWAFGPSSS
jgi:hypothetical protein